MEGKQRDEGRAFPEEYSGRRSDQAAPDAGLRSAAGCVLPPKGQRYREEPGTGSWVESREAGGVRRPQERLPGLG